MSENKSKNLLFLLLLVALVIIAIMGSYIFNLNNTIDTLTPPEGALSEEDAILKATTVLSKYVALSNFETNGVGPMPYLLAELGLDTKDNLDNQCLKNAGKDAYIKSNVTYDDFKSKMLEYVTEEYFNHNFSGYINVDGNVGYKYIAMGIIPISVNKVELFGYNDNEYIFTVTFRDDEMYDHFTQKLDDTKEEDCYFKRKISLTYENDKLLVSEYLNN